MGGGKSYRNILSVNIELGTKHGKVKFDLGTVVMIVMEDNDDCDGR